ncbi:hypothetical protein MVEN_02376700 [Mycena venus]|uniref:Uncharacterized protein n=1 Tax=Mycena venus TaxID=2733690 RepID=A0A8H6X2H9_9AGAR|nr:hypothetical protein MVEN_02376700 [Mycena venus]
MYLSSLFPLSICDYTLRSSIRILSCVKTSSRIRHDRVTTPRRRSRRSSPGWFLPPSNVAHDIPHDHWRRSPRKSSHTAARDSSCDHPAPSPFPDAVPPARVTTTPRPTCYVTATTSKSPCPHATPTARSLRLLRSTTRARHDSSARRPSSAQYHFAHPRYSALAVLSVSAFTVPAHPAIPARPTVPACPSAALSVYQLPYSHFPMPILGYDCFGALDLGQSCL